MTISNLAEKARKTPNPFEVGDKVRVVHAKGTPYDHGHVGIVQRVSKTDIALDGGWSYMHSRFEKVEDEPATPDMNEFLSNKAKELALAIDNGTMAGYYSALGFLVQTLQELAAYPQE